MVKVLIAGDFGLLHHGHIDHICKAYLMSDWLIIATHPDESIIERKKYNPIPLWARIALLKGLLNLLGGQGEVVLADDTNGECTKTLAHYRPDIFAKGGDRISGNLPLKEVELCNKLGIRIVYGVGEQLATSHDLAKIIDESNGE